MKLFYKEPGITMTQFMENIKLTEKTKKIAYTARLDPMASGMVPILFDNECKDIKNHCNNANKIYTVRIFIGIQTDTDDSLGIIQKIDQTYKLNDIIQMYYYILNKVNYCYEQKYHYYSTKMMHHRNRQQDFTDKYHYVKIYKSQIIESGRVFLKQWIIQNEELINKIDKTKNFRQKEIIEQWKNINIDYCEFIDLELTVSSGFFVRQYIRDISEIMKIPLMCFDINRVKILPN